MWYEKFVCDSEICTVDTGLITKYKEEDLEEEYPAQLCIRKEGRS